MATNTGAARKKPGHRSWAPRNGVDPGSHVGDIMSAETRSRVMSRIRSKNTTPERLICSALRQRGLRFSCHPRELPGSPDIVFKRQRLIVFIDGDFWHGWRFPLWKHKLSEPWQKKIEATRRRDKKARRRLKAQGWTVLRIWEHQIEKLPQACVERILLCLEPGR